MSIFKDEYDDFRLGWWALGAILLMFGLPLFVWSFVQVPQYKSACYNYGQVTHRDVKIAQPNWGTVTCYVHMPNGWFDLDQINQNNVAS